MASEMAIWKDAKDERDWLEKESPDLMAYVCPCCGGTDRLRHYEETGWCECRCFGGFGIKKFRFMPWYCAACGSVFAVVNSERRINWYVVVADMLLCVGCVLMILGFIWDVGLGLICGIIFAVMAAARYSCADGVERSACSVTDHWRYRELMGDAEDWLKKKNEAPAITFVPLNTGLWPRTLSESGGVSF